MPNGSGILTRHSSRATRDIQWVYSFTDVFILKVYFHRLYRVSNATNIALKRDVSKPQGCRVAEIAEKVFSVAWNKWLVWEAARCLELCSVSHMMHYLSLFNIRWITRINNVACASCVKRNTALLILGAPQASTWT